MTLTPPSATVSKLRAFGALHHKGPAPMSTLVDDLRQAPVSAPVSRPPPRARNFLTTRLLTFFHETALPLAWTSPTNWLYGHRRLLPHPRAASSLPPTQRSSEPSLSATRGLLRRCQGRLGGALREKIRILERLRRHRGRSLPRLWCCRSGFRKTQVRSMQCRKIVNTQLQTKRYLSVMRRQTCGRLCRLSQG